MGAVAKKTKNSKVPSPAAMAARERLAENVVMLMDEKYPLSKYRTESERQKRLARDVRCKPVSIQRVVRPVRERDADFKPRPRRGKAEGEQLPIFPTLALIADIASAFGVSVSQLLDHNLQAKQQRTNAEPFGSAQDELQPRSG